jgi:hypothetical protein
MDTSKKLAFSARKDGGFENSPHPIRTERQFSPHPQKNLGKWPHGWIFGWAGTYATAFQYAPEKFWEMVESLRGIQKSILNKNKLTLGRNALKEVTWKSELPNPIPDYFVSAFIDAVRAKTFPKGREARARFLGNSLGAVGTVSPRRSRDICGQERAKTKRATRQPEFYINCCGKKRWTVGQVCPECARNPLSTNIPFLLQSLAR